MQEIKAGLIPAFLVSLCFVLNGMAFPRLVARTNTWRNNDSTGTNNGCSECSRQTKKTRNMRKPGMQGIKAGLIPASLVS